MKSLFKRKHRCAGDKCTGGHEYGNIISPNGSMELDIKAAVRCAHWRRGVVALINLDLKGRTIRG